MRNNNPMKKVRVLEDVDFWLNDRIYKADEIIKTSYLGCLGVYVVYNYKKGSIDYLKPKEIEVLE